MLNHNIQYRVNCPRSNKLSMIWFGLVCRQRPPPPPQPSRGRGLTFSKSYSPSHQLATWARTMRTMRPALVLAVSASSSFRRHEILPSLGAPTRAPKCSQDEPGPPAMDAPSVQAAARFLRGACEVLACLHIIWRMPASVFSSSIISTESSYPSYLVCSAVLSLSSCQLD